MSQRGDIFLNLHPDRLEVVNPGPLPLGVTPQNVLHTTVRRRILKPEVIDFIATADQTYQLTQRERVALGLLAQHDAMTARASVVALNNWSRPASSWRRG